MSMKVTPLSPALGAEVEGVTLTGSITEEEIEAITAALLKHHVLFFRNQPMTPQEQHALGSRFGELHVHPIYPSYPGLPGVMVLDTDGNYPPDNDNWHTDVTWIKTPPLGTILSAKVLPPAGAGGDTLWTSCAAAFDDLSHPVQELLLGLRAEHSFLKSFPMPRQWRQSGDPVARWEEACQRHLPVIHPVVRTHPVTGRKGLFVSEGFTTRVVDVSQRESDALLAFLFAHIVRPEFSMRWRWQVHDVAFWDNRITQHYAVGDYLPHRRVMHRVTIIGDEPF